jgi:hypothetical protein
MVEVGRTVNTMLTTVSKYEHFNLGIQVCSERYNSYHCRYEPKENDFQEEKLEV